VQEAQVNSVCVCVCVLGKGWVVRGCNMGQELSFSALL
jgi:hypothetical protein